MRHVFSILYIAFAVAASYVAFIVIGLDLGIPLTLLCLMMPVLFLGGTAACYASGKKRYALLVLPWLYPIALFLLLSAGYTGDY